MKNENYIDVYMTAYKEKRSMKWIAEQLGVTQSAVSIRKKALVNAGVKLPEIERIRETIDVKTLNERVMSHK